MIYDQSRFDQIEVPEYARDDSGKIISFANGTTPPSPFSDFPVIGSVAKLRDENPDLRPVVINGLLREGDVANIIAAPKVGKSWLAMGMGMSVASGRKWLDHYETTQGRVLYIDNELHRTDSAFRMGEICDAMWITRETQEKWCDIVSFRGFPAELLRVCAWLRHILADKPKGYYKLIVIDTLSKMLAGDKSENDNLYMRSIYTQLESIAEQLGAAVAIVHHSSRGDQSEKAVTDVGAGAGSQSRACDAHIVIRPHAEEGWFVMDAMVRSFKGEPGLSLKWEYPLWTSDSVKEPELGSKTAKKTQEKASRVRREVLAILNAVPGGRFTVNQLRSKVSGTGPDVIRRACEQLAEEGVVNVAQIIFHGRDVSQFYI